MNNREQGLTKANQKRKLADLNEDWVELQALKRQSLIQQHAGHADLVADTGGDAAVEETSDDESESGAPPTPADDPEPPAPEVVEEPVLAAAAAEVAGEEGEEPLVWPDMIEGCPVKFENHWDRMDMGLRIQCFKHPGCKKYRSINYDPFAMGPRAAVFYLGAWASMDLPAGEHQRAKPTKANVQAYRDGLA